MSTAPYYILLEQEPNQPWTIQFGYYDRSCVKFEMDEMKYSAKLHNWKLKYTILKTEDSLQATIDKAVTNFNSLFGY